MILVRRFLDDAELQKRYLARAACAADFDTLVQSDAVARDVDSGRIVFVFCPRAIPATIVDLAREAYADLDDLEPPSLTRRAAAGFIDEARFARADVIEVVRLSSTTARLRRADGRLLVQPMSNPVSSYLAGYSCTRFGRRNVVGRVTQRYPDKWAAVMPFFQAVDRVLARELPDVYQRHRERCALHPRWTIAGTALSTVTINVNYEARYHRDVGDFRDGYSALSVAEIGTYVGGLFVLPAYRVAIDVRDGDVLLCQSHVDLHGNTAIVPQSREAKRLSFVVYLKHKLAEGVNHDEEPQRAAQAEGA